MICTPCKSAGRLIPPGQPDTLLADLMASLHAQCRGGTQCDCQHQLRTVLRPDRAADPRRGA